MKHEKCPYCSMPVYQDLKRVTFQTFGAPIRTVEIIIAAEWCTNPDCYTRIQGHNILDHEGGEFTDAVAKAREMLTPITSGLIERGCRVSQYDANPGDRKTTLKDAREIAKRVYERLNVAINKFNERIFQ